jgi:hypothetical protein
MAELSVGATRTEFAAPIANGRSQLESRLNLLLNETRNRGRLLLKIRLAGVLAGLAALLFMVVVQAPRSLVLAVAQPEITVNVPVMVTDYLVHVSPRDTGLAASVLDNLFFMPTEVPVVPVMRFQMPAWQILSGSVACSPDGRWIAYVPTNGEQRAIWIQQASSLTARPLSGTEGAEICSGSETDTASHSSRTAS